MPASQNLSRRQIKRKETTRSLLDEGLKLMAEKGIHACKVEEITQAAGVGKGTFFNYFPSKEAFVARLVNEVLDDLARRVRPVGLTPADAESLMAGVGAIHLRYFQLRPHAASLITQACSMGQTDDGESVRRLAEHVAMLSQMLKPAAEHLGWPDEHVKELGLVVLAVSCGFFWFGGSLGLCSDTPLNLLDRLGKVMARGLKAP